MLKNEDLMDRLRKICDNDNECYTFIFTITPNPSTYKGVDSVDIQVMQGESNVDSAHSDNIERAVMLLKEKFKPQPEIIERNGKKYKLVEIKDNNSLFEFNPDWTKYR